MRVVLLRPSLALGLLVALAAGFLAMAGGQTPPTGPATERRFPPLEVAPGFKATLFACDPLIEYPSVIAAGPKAHQLFVAIDYMTGLGVEIVRRDEIRLIEDTDNDGYADKATVVAAGFNSIQGLAYHDGTIYVMHAPFLSALRDPDGDGKFDERRDLLSGLGLEPEKNPPRLHCANGVTVGHDGWLYLSLGDHGCNVPRPEGDRLIFNGGGILRCRPVSPRATPPAPPSKGGEPRVGWWNEGGRDLHVFASGLRNIYDVALDEELNVFTRDNENDGGDYMIRVCHSFFGADHGYPYLYYERPDEAMPPIADLGRGSSAGVVIYLETAFPKIFRGNLFCCEWGRSLVRYPLKREAGGFAQTKELEFAASSPKDPYGFKPTDVVVQRDGALMVSDWCDGQRPKRGRGRIYRITPDGKSGPANLPDPDGFAGLGKAAGWEARLNSPAYHIRVDAQQSFLHFGRKTTPGLDEAWKQGKLQTRGRMHAVWIFAQLEGADAIPRLLKIARNDPDAQVQAQAIRVIADLADPVLRDHRLDAGRGDPKLAQQLVTADSLGGSVLLETVIALGRLRWADAPGWFQRSGLASPLLREHALVHAMQQTLRRADNWPAVLKLLDLPEKYTLRTIALRALADQPDATIVDGLIERLAKEKSASRRREYADLLTRVHKKPGPWVYWNYRPAPRTPNSVAWERTDPIEKALNQAMTDSDPAQRVAMLKRMQREKIPVHLAALSRWVQEDRDEKRVATILAELPSPPSESVHEILSKIVIDKQHAVSNRRKALSMWLGKFVIHSQPAARRLAETLEDGPVLADVLGTLVPDSTPKALFLAKLDSRHDDVRAAAIHGLGHLKAAELEPRVPNLLADPDPRVRAASAFAAGRMRLDDAKDELLKLVKDVDPAVRNASLLALHDFPDPRAAPLALAALHDASTRRNALTCLNHVGRMEHVPAIVSSARQHPSADFLPDVVQMLAGWKLSFSVKQGIDLERSLAELQGDTGILAQWHVHGPTSPSTGRRLIEQWAGIPERLGDRPRDWKAGGVHGSDWNISLREDRGVRPPGDKRPPTGGTWVAIADFVAPEAVTVQFLGASRGAWHVWLNGRAVFENAKPSSFVGDPDRFEVKLAQGVNRLSVLVASPTSKEPDAEFRIRFRKKIAAANHEQLMQTALAKAGNADRGKKLFLDTAKSQCLKCHRLGDQGEKIGPDLTGVGNRFARVYLIESILEPNRTIAPSYETLQVQLQDGRVLNGVRMLETPDALTIGDTKGDKHVLTRKNIDVVRSLTVSTMPDGLERGLSADDFVDLIAFLVGQK